MNNTELINKLKEIVNPIVTDKGYELYHIEFVNEEKEYYLRIYIDSVNGISLDDCEKVSREVSSTLDKIDPIDCGYYLEVSSPGIYRTLYTEEHIKKAIGKKVCIMLKKSFDSKKKFTGTLIDINNENIKITLNNEEIEFERNNISEINLCGEE